MAKISFTAEEVADIVNNDDIHYSNLDNDGEQSSHGTSDTVWGNGDGSPLFGECHQLIVSVLQNDT